MTVFQTEFGPAILLPTSKTASNNLAISQNIQTLFKRGDEHIIRDRTPDMRRLMTRTENYLMSTPPSVRRRRKTLEETKSNRISGRTGDETSGVLHDPTTLQTPMYVTQHHLKAAEYLPFSTPNNLNYYSSMNKETLLERILTRRKARTLKKATNNNTFFNSTAATTTTKIIDTTTTTRCRNTFTPAVSAKQRRHPTNAFAATPSAGTPASTSLSSTPTIISRKVSSKPLISKLPSSTTTLFPPSFSTMENKVNRQMEQSRTLRNSTIGMLNLPLPSKDPTVVSPTLTPISSLPSSSSPLSTAHYHSSVVDRYTANTQWSYGNSGTTGTKNRAKDARFHSHRTTPSSAFGSNSNNKNSDNSHLILKRPVMLMGRHDEMKSKDQQAIVKKLLQPMLDGGTFHVQHGSQPLPCTFSLNQNMSMLKWIAQGKTKSHIGGNINISQIISVHQNKMNSSSMELRIKRNDGSNVVLRLLSMSEKQCIEWISGIYYLRSAFFQEFFEK